ncbi:gramicidin S synthase 2 [Kordia sp. SMS9]|uniref:non-ribosomal peptide synthetase n=1 Tax=Kordia sp. SMS9 TaxID=2282170 RepID=UPI000E0CF71D|nr:non-ribosomal peptide synthetase [Kordia sp. SMS9]AXG70721.1 gramicidin S synthase 2 [Kordia sp. SMS9]
MAYIHLLIQQLREKKIGLQLKENDLELSIPDDVTLDTETIERLKKHKHDIVAYLKEIDKQIAFEAIEKSPVQEKYPVSSSQHRFWIVSQFEDANKAYTISNALRLEGRLDISFLETAFAYVLERHESLRTYFKSNADGEVFQYIQPFASVNFQLEKIVATATAEETNAVAAFHETTFNLETAPLLRVLLIQTKTDSHILLLKIHHIIGDGWSMQVLANEIMTVYNQLINNQAIALPVLPIQYKDYVVWNKTAKKQHALQQQKSYWVSQFSQETPGIQLPFAKKRPSVKTFNGAVSKYILSKEVHTLLTEGAKNNGYTLFMLLMAGLKGIFHRYTGHNDITFGTPIAGREHPSVQRQIGLFINTLAIKTALDAEMSFHQLIENEKQTLLAAYKHQEYPFDSLLEEIAVKRDASRSPLFDYMVVLQNQQQVQDDDTPHNELEMFLYEGNHLTVSQFDITFIFQEVEGSILLNLEYNTDIYEQSSLNTFIDHFQRFLLSGLETPTQKLHEIQFLSDREKLQLQSDLSGEHVEINTNVVSLFEAQVKKSPNAIALSHIDSKLTYKQLDAMSNQLAHYLQHKGVQKDTLVPICVERSLDMIVGILAIIKVGAAYVPINPNTPTSRIDFIVKDTNASIMLTQQHLLDAEIRKNNALDIIYLDTDVPKWHQFTTEKVQNSITPTQIIYAIYTSGTTGKPKGVLVTHQGIANFTLWSISYHGFKSDDIFGKYLNFAFDASLEELFPALLSGAQIKIIPEEILLETAALNAYTEQHQITVLVIPAITALVDEFIQYNHSIRLLICGGDKLPYKTSPSFTIYNHYGLTETSVTSLAYELKSGNSRSFAPIGTPITNTEVYVLDTNLNRVAKSVVGELYIGGIGVAKGYLNRPKLTAERFIENPFKKGTSLYKTGDLVRVSEDNTIEFLGRQDDQVKLNGYRIELAEIAYELQQIPAIDAAIVIAQKSNITHNELVAYYTAKQTLDSTELQEKLADHLPSYMIPSIYMYVEEFVYTANGKIDKKSLPTPDKSQHAKRKYTAPVSELEKRLATIWEEVLGIENIGIHDNFFDSGGDSIKAIQLVSKSKIHAIFYDVRTVFTQQTIAKILENLEEEKRYLKETGILSGAFGLHPIQHTFFNQKFAVESHHNQAVLLTLSKSITETQLSEALSILVKHHDALRLQFYTDKNTNSIQQAYGDQYTNLTVVPIDDLKTIGEKCTKYQADLDIYKGDIARFVLFQTHTSETFNRLFIGVHHLAVDGISWRILIEDLQTVLASGTLPEKGTSYRQWIQRLEKYATSEELQAEIGYWKKGLSKIPSFPVDFPSGKKKTQHTIASTELIFNKKLTADLLTSVHQAYGTEINDILLSALVAVLSSWTANKTTVIALEGHGREAIFDDVDIHRTLGWFTSLFPVHITTDDDSLENIIATTKDTLRGIPNKGIGFGILKNTVKTPEMKQAFEREFTQVLFNYLGSFDTTAATVEKAVAEKSTLGFAPEYAGDNIAAENEINYGIAINGMLVAGELRLTWSYSSALYKKETIQHLSNAYETSLKNIVSHCKNVSKTIATPSDFKLPTTITHQALQEFKKSDQHKDLLIEDIVMLSPLQEGLLYHDIYDENAAAYTVQFSFEMKGAFHQNAFNKTWETLVKRHTILRTIFFPFSLLEPVQCVYETVKLPVTYVDYSALSISKRQETIADYLVKDKEKGFTLAEELPFRISVLAVDDDTKHIVFTNHHILWDGWSFSLLMKEFTTLYTDFCASKKAPKTAIDNYGNYVRKLKEKHTAKGKTFWKEYLKNIEAPTYLPFIKNTNERNKIFGNSEQHIQLEETLSSQIKAFAEKNRLTYNTVFQGAWAYLLSKYTGNRTTNFGVVISGRDAKINGIEQSVGLYINTIVLCSTIEPTTAIISWLQDVQKNHLIAREEYAYLPLNQIEAASPLQSNLFDSLLVFENYPIEQSIPKTSKKESTFTVDNIQISEQTNYSLSLSLSETKEAFTLKMMYHNDVISDGSIQRITGHLQEVLKSITNGSEKIAEINFLTKEETALSLFQTQVEKTPHNSTVVRENMHTTYQELDVLSNPDILVKDLVKLTANDKKNIVATFDKTQVAFPKEETIVSLFQKQVEKTPNNIAVVCEQEEITYKELDAQSNQLAHYLLSIGVQNETLVPICVTRTKEMIVSILAILKAGGAYVPIDPKNPISRIQFIIHDCNSAIFITDDNVLKEKLQHQEIKIVSITENQPHPWEQFADKRIAKQISPKQLAYVIYTSGTTGNPKGVLIEHQNVVRLFFTKKALFNFSETDVWSMFHSYNFDFSVWEMYGALFFGGKLVIIPSEQTKELHSFVDTILTQKITVLNQTPSTFYVVKELLLAANIPNAIRYIIFGGEALQPQMLSDWYAENPKCKLINMYGITETTVHVTYKEIGSKEIEENVSNIGVPIPTLGCFILDESLHLLPPGVVGELHISGAGLARGYLNNAELTAEKFIKNPFVEGERLYKSGDLAKVNQHGELEYFGRKDDQVKIRGYRIELKEIESQLETIPNIKQAVVLVKEDSQKNKQLRAYYSSETYKNPEDIQKQLRSLLPAYMVPKRYQYLKEFPLTANNKIDKKALVALDETVLQQANYVAPTTPKETKLVAIWNTLLELENVGTEDDFFDIGGDSIKIIRLISHIKKAFDVKIGLIDFHTNPTIKGIAALLEKMSGEELASSAQLQQDIRTELKELEQHVIAHPKFQFKNMPVDILPMSDIQIGMMVTSEMMRERGELAIYHDQMVVELATLDIDIVTQAYKLLIQKHEIFRTTFNLYDFDKPIQFIHKEGNSEILFEDITELSSEAKKEFISNFLREEREEKAFILNKDFLYRLAIYKVSETNMILIFQFHHAILDGWSDKSFRSELLETYFKLQKDANYKPAPLHIGFRESVIADKIEANNEANKLYWKKELQNYKRLDILSTKVVQNEKVIIYPNTLHKAVIAQCKQDKIAPKSFFLATYLYALQLFSSEEEITIGLVSNRRPLEKDGDKLLGCFLNTTPFRFSINTQKREPLRRYVQNVHAKLNELKGRDRFSLVDISKLHQENQNENPFFDVLFDYVDFHVVDNLLESDDLQNHIQTKKSDDLGIDEFAKTNTFFDLVVSTTADDLILRFTQNRALTSNRTLTDFIAYYNTFIEKYIENANYKLTNAVIISKEEKEELVAVHHTISKNETLLDAFAKQVLKTPNAIAIQDDTQQLSYKALDEKSNQIAHYIQNNYETAEGDLIGIMLSNSVEMLLGILGTLKAGLGYIPIDIAYPIERKERIIEHAELEIVLTMMKDLDPSILMFDIDLIDLEDETIYEETTSNIQNTLQPTATCYVIYTSGSTGTPKGVAITHAALYNYVSWGASYYAGDKPIHFPLFTSISFDLTITALFLPIITGGTIVAYQNATPFETLIKIVENPILNAIKLTPSHLQILKEINDVTQSAITTIIVGGEQLDGSLAEEITHKFNSNATIYNEYGPTEATVGCSVHIFEPNKQTKDALGVSIGKPIANTNIYILDEQLDIVPKGVLGELCVSGAGLSKGYLNQPELTNQKFIDNPFQKGSKLYKTGDLGTWNADGNLEFHGRKDDQVKIRGYRIELEEIKSHLENIAEIKQAIIQVVGDASENKELVAYYTSNEVLEAERLREKLSAVLPQYMLPRLYIYVKEFVLTINGKIDKNLLPTPNLQSNTSKEYSAPTTEIQKQLVTIWQRFLEVDTIGIQDNFFDLGGNSITAIRMVSAIEQEIGYTIGIKDVLESPRIENLAKIVENTSKTPATTISKQPYQKNIPLSFAQERLWFIDKLHGSIEYHIPYILEFKGKLDPKLVETSLKHIIQRHQTLRTIFKEYDGIGYQEIQSEAAFTITKVQSQLSEKQLENYIAEAIAQPFNLAKDYMLRCSIYSKNTDNHVIILVMHHIASDGWSLPIFIKEFDHIYNALQKGKPIALPELPIQYKDYSIWQRTQLSDELLKEKLSFWKQQLKDTEPLAFPTDFARPKIQSKAGETFAFQFSIELSQKLQQFAKKQETTLFTILLSLYKILLHKYTGQSDITVGTPVANRKEKEVFDLIGFFVNTLVIRNQIAPTDTFESIIQNVKTTSLNAFENQEVPFEKIVEELVIERDTSRHPLFQTMFILQNNEVVNDFAVGNTEMNMLETHQTTTKFDLTLNSLESQDRISFIFEYATALFKKETIQQMATHIESLANILVDAATTKIETISYLQETATKELLETFNNTKKSYPTNTTFLTHFAEQVQKTPDAIALIFEAETMTFKELDIRSNQLARHLQNKGAKENTFIPICTERSIEMMVGIIAILKTGAAYVPVDPNYPKERIQFIIEDCNATLILTQKKIAQNKLHAIDEVTCIPLDETHLWAHETAEALHNNYASETNLYVIYTSGTTGKPKGVINTHKAVINRLFWMKEELKIDNKTVVLHKTPYVFDVSVWELLMPLITGCTLVIAKPEGHKDPQYLSNTIQKHAVHLIHFVPSMLAVFLEHANNIELPSLQHVICSGEALSASLKNDFITAFNNINLWNYYGPTEAAIDVTSINISSYADTEIVPIGKPVANTSIYILDANMKLVPKGVRGELYIGGIQVAKGYLNRPTLTAEKFIENPFQKGARIYKTGDIVKWRTDGTIEFIGRADNTQVKIRGFRIELGAIQTKILQHKNIRTCVVLAKTIAASQELVAYYVADIPITAASLREHIEESLPQYMSPSYCIQLPNMPLNTNGKIDTKALPNPNVETSQNTQHFKAAETAIEKQVVSIWEDVLQRKEIGMHDDFFALGGHSLRAIRLLNKYHKEFEIRLELSDLFSETTVASQVALLSASDTKNYEEIPVLEAQADYAVSSGQHRLWILSQFKEGSLAYHMPNFVYLEGNHDVTLFQKAVHAVVERHEILRTIFKQQKTGEVRQHIIPTENYNFTIGFEDFSNHENSEVAFENYRKQDAQLAFDLENGPLFRCCLMQLSEKQYAFYYNLHHIISDGWSMDVLREDVMKYYQYFHQETAIDIAPLRIQYKDFSQWQLQQSESENQQAAQTYWTEKFQGELPILNLPTTKLRPKVKTYNGQTLETSISDTNYRAIQKFVSEHGGSTFMVLLASWQAIFYRYSGLKDQIIGTPTSGRTHKELENQIGFYINTLALRNTLEKGDSFATFYERIKQNTLESFNHQAYPFDRLVEDLKLNYDTSRSALFDVLLTLNQSDEASESRKNSNTIVELGQTMAKFDIEISFQETDGQLSYVFIYNEDVYDQSIMKQLMQHYQQLLGELVSNATTNIDHIAYLSAVEKEALVHHKPAIAIEDNLLSDFTKQVLKTPEHTAIIIDDVSLTYQEVEAFSNQFAHYLIHTYQVATEERVALKLTRSEWMPIAILGILKSGAAYVPIDPNYPQERIDYIASDSNCKVSIDEAELTKFKENKDAFAKTTLTIPIVAANLAYVIYTSGSTGTPKGVMIAHKNAVSMLQWAQKEFAKTAFDIMYFVTSYCFDLSIYELFYPLSTGKTIRILENGLAIKDHLETDKNIAINTVPSVIETLLAQQVNWENVVAINMAGEPIPQQVSNALPFSRVEVRNLYGPSEDTTYSSCYRIEKTFENDAIPMGKPIDQTQFYILSESMQLQPDYVEGELYIEGAGLAKGYLNKETLTQERFLPNPFKKGQLLYKTGDVVKRLHDGNLVYLRRLDHQIKLRGYRIELGEIEQVIQKYSAINQVVAEVKQVKSEASLVAYFTTEHTIDKALLRSFISEQLPEYMVPSYYLQLETLPRNANGKIDRKQLPEIDDSAIVRNIYVAPETEVQKKLVTLWEELLGIDTIGIEDDFFELGGNSIKAMQLITNMQALFQVTIDISKVFLTPNITQLATEIEKSLWYQDSFDEDEIIDSEII